MLSILCLLHADHCCETDLLQFDNLLGIIFFGKAVLANQLGVHITALANQWPPCLECKGAIKQIVQVCPNYLDVLPFCRDLWNSLDLSSCFSTPTATRKTGATHSKFDLISGS